MESWQFIGEGIWSDCAWMGSDMNGIVMRERMAMREGIVIAGFWGNHIGRAMIMKEEAVN